MSSLSNTGCLGRVGGDGIKVLSRGNSGSHVTSPGEMSVDQIHEMCRYMYKENVPWWERTLSPQSLVRFSDLGFSGKSDSPAVQHFHDLCLHLLRSSVAHVLETTDKTGNIFISLLIGTDTGQKVSFHIIFLQSSSTITVNSPSETRL